MSHIPVDPGLAKALFAVIAYVEAKIGCTLTPWMVEECRYPSWMAKDFYQWVYPDAYADVFLEVAAHGDLVTVACRSATSEDNDFERLISVWWKAQAAQGIRTADVDQIILYWKDHFR